jgi:hypothetical protein
MKEKWIKNITWIAAGLLLIALIVGCISVLGSKTTSDSLRVPLTQPETGLQMWVDAMNQRNMDRLYDLSPDEIKNEVTLAKFKEDNLNNTLLQSGYDFINYSVIDRKENGTYAQITAQIWLHQPANQSSLGPEIPLLYKFALYYQHGEWKIWTLKWT